MIQISKNKDTGQPTVMAEPADRAEWSTPIDITPEAIELIMIAANQGDSRQQSRLARMLLDNNESIIQAMETRRNAVLGCSWNVVPGGPGQREKKAAEELHEELETAGDGDEQDGFEDLVEDLVNAVIPGYAVSEILWHDGGHIAGFHALPGESIHFIDSFLPRLVVRGQSDPISLPRERFVFHRLRRNGNDPARSGLIRPLSWLHCFKQVNTKDLLGFIERHGMPFVIARVDQSAFDTERNLLRRLVRNFGPSGGGVITKNVEMQLLETASRGEVYFRLLEYVNAAVEKLILGQTASSGESAGLSKGDAQSQVRQDILEADCRRVMRTVNIQIAKPWCAYNHGDSVRPPRLQIDYGQPEDRLQLAQTVQALTAAGFDADEQEMSERFGMTLRRRTDAPSSPPVSLGGEARAMASESQPADEIPASALRGWLSPAAALLERMAADELSDEEFERELKRLRDLDRGEMFGDSEPFERVLEEHVADHLAVGAATAWRKLRKRMGS